jgi:Zn-finger nucleic acid-binding protein
MKCPIDGTTLEIHKIQSTEVEECPQCQGIWFEKDELRKAKDESDPDLNWLDFDLWSDEDAFVTDWSTRKCPICNQFMANISYGATGVQLEYCVYEHGVWLDKGEFQAIIDELEVEVRTKSIPDYISSSLHAGKELITGDEGFISEWGDFLTVGRLLQYRLLSENTKLAELLTALQTSSPK